MSHISLSRLSLTSSPSTDLKSIPLILEMPYDSTLEARQRRSAPQATISPFEGWVWRGQYPSASTPSTFGPHGPPSPRLGPLDEEREERHIAGQQSKSWLARHVHLSRHPRRSDDMSRHSSISTAELDLQSGDMAEKHHRRRSPVLNKIRSALSLPGLDHDSTTTSSRSSSRSSRQLPPTRRASSALNQLVQVKQVEDPMFDSWATGRTRRASSKVFYNHRVDEAVGLSGWVEDEEDQDSKLAALNIPYHLPNSPLCPRFVVLKCGDARHKNECPLHPSSSHATGKVESWLL